MFRTVILGCLLVPCLLFAEIMPRGPVRERVPSLDDPVFANWVQESGSVRMNITNRGYFGNSGPGQNDAMLDPCPPGTEWADQCEFPAGSGQQYLFQGAPWFGAEIWDDEDEIWRKRVSVGTDGWFNPSINELHGSSLPTMISNIPGAANCFGDSIYSPNARANQEVTAVFSDTLTDPFWIEPDPTDGLHEPLGIKVTQTSMTWTSPEFSNLVIFEYTVRNIGDQFLRNPSFGLYLDTDIGLSNSQDQHIDDLTGFLDRDPVTGDTLNIAYSVDNDGRPAGQSNGPFATPHTIGVVALSASPDSVRHSFNYWFSNGDVTLDIGPTWQSYALEDSMDMGWTNQYGTAVGDEHKYQIMTNAEVDYDQLRLDNSTYIAGHPQQLSDPQCDQDLSESWRLPNTDPSTLDDMADGYDTRFLYSWGPIGVLDYIDQSGCKIYRLNPGEEFTTTVAIILGRDLHDPEHPQPSQTNINPDLFDFTGLVESARRAHELYDNNYENILTPPRAFHPVGSASGAVTLEWDPPSIGAVAGYELFGILSSSPSETTAFGDTLIEVLTVTVTNLINGNDWRFLLQATDTAGNHSAFVDTLVRVGAVLPVTNLQAVVAGTTVNLFWDASDDPHLTDYVVHRRAINGDTASFITTTNELTDSELVIGRYYDYWITANSSIGIAGLSSDTIRALPWQPQTRLLVVDESEPLSGADHLFGGIHQDSITNFYTTTLLPSLGLEYGYVIQDSRDSLAYSLETLAGFDVVLWHIEGNNNTDGLPYIEAREVLLEDYVRNGGKLIRTGRQLLSEHLRLPIFVNQTPEIFSPFDFDSAYASPDFRPIPGHFPTVEFTGAVAQFAGFPPLSIDTAKTHDLLYLQTTGFNFLPEVEILWPQAPTLPLYRAVVTAEDSSGYGNQPCGVIGENMIVLTFPLYFLQQDDATNLLTASVNVLRFGVDVPDEHAPAIPNQLTLSQNYPNPFNPTTTISFSLPQSGKAVMRVYDIMGRTVETLFDEVAMRGEHQVEFNATSLASGIYFYRLGNGSQFMTRKMILLK